MSLKISEKLQLGRMVTPIPDRKRPVYNWFQMKESFSRDLVGLLVETWGLEKENMVLDPFCGAGTTPLACREFGLDCVGFDVHPMLLFVSRVKLRDYNVDKLRSAVHRVVRSKFERVEVEAPGFVSRVFPTSVLEDIAHFRDKIMEVEDEAIREFMLLGLVSASMQCSWARKDGAAIKVARRPVPPLRKALERQLMRMCRDLEHFRTKPSNTTVEHCDARKMRLEDESVGAVITSPPYLRKQEYASVYRIEQWILGVEGPLAEELIGVRPKGGADENFSEVEEFAKDRPSEVGFYFRDMFSAIMELYRVCRVGGKVCMVTSDGCLPEGVVEVCVPLSELAEKAGFRAKRVIVVNKRYCTTPARKKVGVAREALLMWEK